MYKIKQSELFLKAAKMFAKKGCSDKEYVSITTALENVFDAGPNDIVEIPSDIAVLLDCPSWIAPRTLIDVKQLNQMSQKDIEKEMLKDLAPQDEIDLTRRFTTEAIRDLPNHVMWWSFPPSFQDLVYATIQKLK